MKTQISLLVTLVFLEHNIVSMKQMLISGDKLSQKVKQGLYNSDGNAYEGGGGVGLLWCFCE